MQTKTHKVTIKFTASDYENLKKEATELKMPMAELIRNSWFEKQNALAVFEEFDRRINLIESCINNQKNELKQHFNSNDTKLLAIYKVLKSLSSSENNQENSHD